ncbi:MAG: HypC/HybG/HupF family hydrogenase formation chaperone [Anaerolineales bacterium]
MCLAVPGKILEIHQANGVDMAKVDFEGVQREACLMYLPEAKVGDYILVHVGFAMSLLSEEEALASLDLLRQVADAEPENSTPGGEALS